MKAGILIGHSSIMWTEPASLSNPKTWYTYPQIAVGPLDIWVSSLSSDTDASPRAKHRFGFSGQRKRPKRAEPLTDDDILESLTKQAGSQQELGEAQTKTLELLAESEETQRVFEPEQILPIATETKRSLGRFAFVLMFLGCLVAVWVYTKGGRLIDPSFASNLVQSSGIRGVFANTIEVGVIFLTASILALWVAHRRRNSSLNILDR